MKEALYNIKKTKYRYLMDNLSLFPIRPIITYTIPVPNDPTVDESKQEFFDRKYPDVTITNLHFKHMIDKTAKALVAFGVKAGDIVTICQTNTPEVFYMGYALSKIGAIPNYIYPNVTAEEMKYYMDELDSKYIFILDDDSIRKNVAYATKETNTKIISSTVIESFPTPFKMIASKKMPKSQVKLDNEIKWNEFIKNGKAIKCVKEYQYVPNSIACYIHTSGTSSVPKAVMFSNENINCIPRNYEIDGIEWIAGKKGLQVIPEFVSYGVTTNHLYFCNNINNIIIPEMEGKNYYDLVKKYKPEYSYTTPIHGRELIKRPTDMSKFIMMVFGGDGFDDLEPVMCEYMKNNGCKYPPMPGYGLTEMSAVVSTNSTKYYKYGTIGRLSGLTEGIIVKPDTMEVIKEPNTVGELCLTGPSVTLGYAGNSKDEMSKIYKKHDDGRIYVHTGDFISMDEDKFLTYHGRIKNVITRKSFTFSPEEIVKTIMKHPNVKQCVVVPKYSKEEGETPSAHILLNDYDLAEQTIKEVIDMINNDVQEFHRPTDYKVRESYSLNKNNKIDITALKIEDICSMCEGVLSAQISSINDGVHNYELKIDYNSSLLNIDNDVENKINNYIMRISALMKINMGKIKYMISYIDVNYTDSNAVYKKNSTYVKHV